MEFTKTAFTIKDLENISGVKTHTIRIWEKRYNLLSPERTKSNIRYYSNSSLMPLLGYPSKVGQYKTSYPTQSR